MPGNACTSSFTTPWLAYTGYTKSGITYWDDSSPLGYSVQTITDLPESSRVQSIQQWSTLQNATLITSGVAKVTQIAVWWKASDLARFPDIYALSLASRLEIPVSIVTLNSSRSSSGIATEITSTTGSQFGPDTQASDQTVKEDTSLSMATKVGIVVASAFLFFVVMAAVVVNALSIRRRRKRKLARKQTFDDDAGKAELPGDSLREADPDALMPPEASDNALNEADTDAVMMPLEMSADGGRSRVVAEVKGDRPPVHEADSRDIRVILNSPVELE